MIPQKFYRIHRTLIYEHLNFKLKQNFEKIHKIVNNCAVKNSLNNRGFKI